MDISHLSDTWLVKILSQSVGCQFVLLAVSFALEKICSSVSFIYPLLLLEPVPLVFCLGSCILYQWVQGYFPLSLFWDLIYLVLFWGTWSTKTFFPKVINLHSSTQSHPISPVPFVESAFIFPLYGFAFFIRNRVSRGVCFISETLIWFHWSTLSISVPILCRFYHYCSEVQLEVRDSDSSRKFFYCSW